MHTHTCVPAHSCTHVHTYTHMHLHARARIYTRARTGTHRYTHTRMYTHTHAHLHTHTPCSSHAQLVNHVCSYLQNANHLCLGYNTDTRTISSTQHTYVFYAFSTTRAVGNVFLPSSLMWPYPFSLRFGSVASFCDIVPASQVEWIP